MANKTEIPSTQRGLQPDGDAHTQWALRRLQKMGRQPRQEPGRVTPPAKPPKLRAY